MAADDILFEVETDKSVNEVSAGFDGYLGATLAEAGEVVPTGQTIAIITSEKPANTVARKATSAPMPAPAPQADVAETKQPLAEKPSPAKVATPPAPAMGGKVLASPKARRLAHQEGLDLQRLVDAGYEQPFHVKDLDALRALPAKPDNAAAMAQAAGRIIAEIPIEGFTGFAAWRTLCGQFGQRCDRCSRPFRSNSNLCCDVQAKCYETNRPNS